MPPVTRLFSKRDEAGCALRPGLPDLNGPRNEISSVERLVPRLQPPVEHQGPDGQAGRSKRVPEEFPAGHGTLSLGVQSGTAVLRDSCYWIAAYLCLA